MVLTPCYRHSIPVVIVPCLIVLLMDIRKTSFFAKKQRKRKKKEKDTNSFLNSKLTGTVQKDNIKNRYTHVS